MDFSTTTEVLFPSSPASPTTPTTPQSSSQFSSMLQPPSPNPVKMSSNTMVVDKQYQHLIAWNYTAENQIWEFSHPKFLRGRPDLLDDIKRKAMESETLRRETGDLHAHLAMMQVAQTDLLQQIAQLQENFAEVMRELRETKHKQTLQQQWIKNMWEVIQSQNSSSQSGANGGQSPTHRLNITLPPNPYLGGNNSLINQQPPLSPNSLSSYNTAVNTPLPPSPSPGSPLGNIVSDDDMDGSIYSRAGSEYGASRNQSLNFGTSLRDEYQQDEEKREPGWR
ncbi:9269_t:CDS:2 [Ambispora leptoticha]|uniref:9269_t:CDS:1 n=1 Tax=Ambispora leptoticha TaxID=144679 RepID=A0A9N9BUC9_9GLOM|nr:9269_t:CDS:2 [Ambispora leptoticha]